MARNEMALAFNYVTVANAPIVAQERATPKIEMSSISSANPRTDAELVRDCLNRDESAWYELIEKYKRLVYSIARRYGLGASEADDVFQNVFVIVLDHLSALKNASSLAGWLATITH